MGEGANAPLSSSKPPLWSIRAYSSPLIAIGRPGNCLNPWRTPSLIASNRAPVTHLLGPTSKNRWGIPVSSHNGLRLFSATSALSSTCFITQHELSICSSAIALRYASFWSSRNVEPALTKQSATFSIMLLIHAPSFSSGYNCLIVNYFDSV